VDKYTQAIISCEEMDGNIRDLAVLYLNRSICYLRLEDFDSALKDAKVAVINEPNYVKAYYYRGLSFLGLKKFEDALMDFKLF
jgi:serine/threonine-protein phosphatase 5